MGSKEMTLTMALWEGQGQGRQGTEFREEGAAGSPHSRLSGKFSTKVSHIERTQPGPALLWRAGVTGGHVKLLAVKLLGTFFLSLGLV